MVKRAIIPIGVTATIVTLFTSVKDYILAHPNVKISLIILGGFLALALLVWLFKKLCKLIDSSLASTIFLLALGAATFFLIKYDIINPLIGYYGGLGIGILLAVSCIRWIGKKAETSMIVGEVFSFFTGYGLKSYIERDTIVTKEFKEIEHDDEKNIIEVLTKQMEFTRKEAKEAARYAVENIPVEAPIEQKIKEALKYQDNLNASTN